MLHWYWQQTGGNLLAIPAEAAIAASAGWIFRKPLGQLAAWLRREELAEAAKARRIAADLYRHQTGRAHPDAPGQPGSEGK